MSDSRAIPPGYMTVGELAKKAGTTVRTLQYYDREGVLAPSAVSAGGRRLYTDKDRIKLHQVLSLKHLGFSLDDIKNHFSSLDTPADVAAALTEHAAAIRAKMKSLSESLEMIEALKAEVLQMQSVDFKKYADIIVNLQMQKEFYWLIKHFDDQTLEHMRKRFDKDSGLEMIETITRLLNEAVRLQNGGVPPESREGQKLAGEFWDMVLAFTGGDMDMLPKLIETGSVDGPDNEWKQMQLALNTFMGPALEFYFTKRGINPFEGKTE